jgi:hypothetical protein
MGRVLTTLAFLLGHWTLSNPASAFSYEVLFDETLARDAIFYGRGQVLVTGFKSVLLDGQVKTDGTDATTYDRLLVSSVRVLHQVPLSGNLALRGTLPVVLTYEKTEGDKIPRIITEATWFESKPKVELIYATQNNLDLVFGLNVYAISKYKVNTESENFTASDTYSPVTSNFGHLALVKHAGTFDGGFAFQFKAEKTRKLTKQTSLETDARTFEDRVYQPTTIAIFANTRRSFGDLYGEFAAVEASGGGNVSEVGRYVREDYFRFQLAGLFPLNGKSLGLESSLLYKSLSYADNRAVTLDTIPMAALHLKLHVDYGLPFFVGLIGVRGTDGQSLQEFNAQYKLFGVGGTAGLNLML